MIWSTILALIVCYTVSTVAIPIDNAVLGTSVQCTADSIAVNFTTKNPFTGRIFVKGMSDKPDCVRSYADDSAQAPLITFTFGECNMQRSRTLTPQSGMLQSIVVVISFHRMFITKVDRAYKVQCFYMESEKTVTSQLDVSMITTDIIRETMDMPVCTYEVRRESLTGEIVKYAKVGDPVYHIWTCNNEEVRILVKNCVVDDGQGNRQNILDENGCAMDAVILADLTYESTGNARAWVESHVFKYADKPSVFFQCTIQICSKGDPQCDEVSPPKCLYQMRTRPSEAVSSGTTVSGVGGYTRRRSKRRISSLISHSQPTFSPEMDLLTDPISVLDLEDAPSNDKLRHFDEDRYAGKWSESEREASDTVCMSTTGFAVLVGAAATFLACLIVTIVLICIGKSMRRGRKL